MLSIEAEGQTLLHTSVFFSLIGADFKGNLNYSYFPFRISDSMFFISQHRKLFETVDITNKKQQVKLLS